MPGRVGVMREAMGEKKEEKKKTLKQIGTKPWDCPLEAPDVADGSARQTVM
jgi:hypothetical protein